MTGLLRIGIAVPLLCGAFLALPGCGEKDAPQITARPAGRGQVETNVPSVVAELVECRRKDGVLTVQLRFSSTSDKLVNFYAVSGGNFDAWYVTAEDRKYFVLRDEAKKPLAPQVDPSNGVFVSIKPGGTWTWWAKYPAPPAAVKKVSYYTAISGPFDDIPITEGGPEEEKPAKEALKRAKILRIVGIPALPASLAAALKELGAELADRQARIALPAEALFEAGAAELRPEAGAELEQVAMVLRDFPAAPLAEPYPLVPASIESLGGDAALAAKRAAAVKDWLVENAAIDPARLSMQAQGGAQESARVEITVRKGS